MDLSYLYALGYTREEIDEYTENWNEAILRYLADNAHAVAANMQYLHPYFEKDLLLKLPVFYCDAFVLPPETFKERLSVLQNAFPTDWNAIIEKQFWGYDGIRSADYQPFLQAMGGSNGEDVRKAIEQLQHPETCTFEFMAMLSDAVGPDVCADALADRLDAEQLLALEECKNELVRSAKMLADAGLPHDILETMLECAPFLLTEGEKYVGQRLTDVFGADYVPEMEKAYADGTLADILFTIG